MQKESSSAEREKNSEVNDTIKNNEGKQNSFENMKALQETIVRQEREINELKRLVEELQLHITSRSEIVPVISKKNGSNEKALQNNAIEQSDLSLQKINSSRTDVAESDSSNISNSCKVESTNDLKKTHEKQHSLQVGQNIKKGDSTKIEFYMEIPSMLKIPGIPARKGL